MLMLCPCALFMIVVKANLIGYWILLNSSGNPVSDGMMEIRGTMARLPFPCPVVMRILRLFGMSHLTTCRANEDPNFLKKMNGTPILSVSLCCGVLLGSRVLRISVG